MKRYLPYVAALVVLGGLNFVRWRTPEALGQPADAGVGHQEFAARDYRVRMTSGAAPEDLKGRDLFYSESAAPPVHAQTARARPVGPPAPPPKTPQELEEEQARADLGALKVTGIAFRGGKGQAFVTAGEESYIVRSGDRIANRFDVLEITSEYVSVKDPATGVGAKVPLQGD